jgi:hypothetical protein
MKNRRQNKQTKTGKSESIIGEKEGKKKEQSEWKVDGQDDIDKTFINFCTDRMSNY